MKCQTLFFSEKKINNIFQNVSAAAVISALTFTTLRANSADDQLVIFRIFPGKQDLKFHASCQNVKTCFQGKFRKIFKMSSADNFTQSAKR